jgi:hypothetical protein
MLYSQLCTKVLTNKAAQEFHGGLNAKASPSENCEVYMQNKKEEQRVTDLIAMLLYTSDVLLDKTDKIFC